MKTPKIHIIRNKHTDQLNHLSSLANFVWNNINDLNYKHLQKTGKLFSTYSLNKYTKDNNEILGLQSQTINKTYTKNHKPGKKAKLNGQTNNPKSQYPSLNELPFKQSTIKHINTYKITQDNYNRWYACIIVKDDPKQQCATGNVGINFGLKDNTTTVSKEKLAKSIYNAACFELKRPLEYKCKYAGCQFEIVKDKYTTQACSCCGWTWPSNSKYCFS